jgi:2-methylcitrate dehydratase PrpD
MSGAARARATELILDLLGVAYRGSSSPSSTPVYRLVQGQGRGAALVLGSARGRGTRLSSGTGQTAKDPLQGVNDLWHFATPARGEGDALRVAAAWAALANGTAAHAIEMDDVTTESSLHPGAAVIPAALAVAEEIAGSEARVRTAETACEAIDPHLTPSKSRPGAPLGARVVEAVAAGYEVTIRIGNALGAASAYQRGFHPTGVAGVFGAAVAAGKLMHLDADGLASAIGIAGTMASGSLAYLDDGSWTKRLNPGWAAHSGVVAAGLAFAGFTGPATALDGPHGLLRGYTDAPDPERLTEGLGTDPLQLMRVSLKPYGCCRYSHGLIDAVLALRAEHFAPDGRERTALTDIERIRLGVLSGGWPLIAEDLERKRHPRNTVDAQFSAPYAAAVALVHGRAGLREFEIGSADQATGELRMGDALMRALMERTECYRDASLDAEYPKSWRAAVEIHLKDGRVLRQRIEHALGEPEHPVSRTALVERFVDMLAPRREEPGFASLRETPAMAEQAARDVAERILHLDQESDLAVLEALA